MSFEEEVKKLIKITKGEVLGTAIQSHIYYIREREGEEGLKKVQTKLEKLGYSIDFQKIKALEWLPAVLDDLIILTAKEVFDWKDEKIFDMGKNAPKYSFIIKLFFKYFLSTQKSLEQAPQIWKKYYTSGTLEAYKINEKEKYLILRLKHQCHPLICVYYSGYFLGVAQYIIKTSRAIIEETKCMSKGDSFHEFIIKWE